MAKDIHQRGGGRRQPVFSAGSFRTISTFLTPGDTGTSRHTVLVERDAWEVHGLHRYFRDGVVGEEAFSVAWFGRYREYANSTACFRCFWCFSKTASELAMTSPVIHRRCIMQKSQKGANMTDGNAYMFKRHSNSCPLLTGRLPRSYYPNFNITKELPL